MSLLVKMLITLEPHGIFFAKVAYLYILTLSKHLCKTFFDHYRLALCGMYISVKLCRTLSVFMLQTPLDKTPVTLSKVDHLTK